MKKHTDAAQDKVLIKKLIRQEEAKERKPLRKPGRMAK